MKSPFVAGKRVCSIEMCTLNSLLYCNLQSPFYDVVDVESIVDIVCLRPVPAEKALRSFNTTDKLFFVNKFAK